MGIFGKARAARDDVILFAPDKRAALQAHFVRDDAEWLAEILIDLEDDVGEIARLVLIDELRRTLAP